MYRYSHVPTSPGSSLSLVDNRFHTHALTPTYSGTLKTSPLGPSTNSGEENNNQGLHRPETIAHLLTILHRTGLEQIPLAHQFQPYPRLEIEESNNHNALLPPQKALRPSNSPPPSLPRHRLRAHLRAPRRHRRQIHSATFGLLPEPADSAGRIAQSARGSWCFG